MSNPSGADSSKRPFPAAMYSADKVRRRPPSRRRLQIFAVDPGASNRLDTAFINKTVIDVPWEGEATDANRSAGSVREEGEAAPANFLFVLAFIRTEVWCQLVVVGASAPWQDSSSICALASAMISSIGSPV